MKKYKVIKEFGCAQKGDVLQENEEGLFELNETCDCNDCYCSRSVCISADIADTLLSAEFLAEINEETESCCDKLTKLSEYIDSMISQYEQDHEALMDEYNEGNVPQCLKVEADTVYFNMIKVLKHIKDLLDE